MDRHPHPGSRGPPNQSNPNDRPNPPPIIGAIPRKRPSHPAPHQPPPIPHAHARGPPPQAGYRPQQYMGPPPPGYRPPPHQNDPHRRPSPSYPPQPPPRTQKPLASAHVPRKLPTAAHRTAREAPSHVVVKSEQPFVIRIKNAREIPMNNGGLPRMRSSSRKPKRKRPTYEELRDTDSDDFMTDEEGENFASSFKKGRLHKARSKPRASPTDGLLSSSSAADVVMSDSVHGADSIDSPPPGTLSTLWYSREVFINVFVLEKIIGWKTRLVTKLEWKDENDIKVLDPLEALSISNKLLLDGDFWANRMKRMEVSRIFAAQCPLVMVAAAAKEGKRENPRYALAPRKEEDREEVLLVKWRGRSHMHCSWERRKDLEKFDPSNNTAKNKIRRFFQGQEVAMGKDWKKVIENERASNVDPAEAQDGIDEEEEFIPPQYLEVERILACDENEMDLKVMAKQRALNLRTEQDALRKREEEDSKQKASEQTGETIHHTHKAHRLFDDLPVITDGDPPWDPEDNVRYVVKWKGLQYAEMTWEYWRDIKRDAVDETEDFWDRQKAPSLEEVTRISNRPHPLIRDFRKLPESPEFAISHRPRPLADLGDGFKEDDEEDKEPSEGFQLRSYQLEGVNWLLFNWFNRRSCILADEMGLGKTIQSVGFLHQLHQLPTTQVRGPFLIVAPLSVIAQWQSETRTWCPDLNVVFYHGSADARDFLVQQEFYYTEQFVPKATALKLKKKHITKFHILITTYEVVLKDIDVLSKIRWKTLIVDEAHRLKNPKARLFEELAKVPRDFCLLLTGTPLQNSTDELWALLNFANPVSFASKETFIEKFGQLTDAKQVSDLHSILKPYLLRRVKEDVEKSLPPKEETILEVSLTPIQKTYYKAIYEKNTSFLFKGAKPSNSPSLMNIMMELRKCCNHPFLIRGAEDRILNEAAIGLKEKKNENGNEIPIDYLKLFGDQLVSSSGKMVLLAKLLPKLFAGGHKVLIFSQMVRVLDLLEELMKIQNYKYERLDGSTTASARSAAVDRFHRKSCQRFVMLLSTRAGGLGLNLTAADIVIIFDSDWNPQNDLQAMARAHRIGQTRAVSVYRLLTAKTYEMHMFHSASLKLGLDRAVLAHQRQQETEDGQEAKSKSKSEREMQAKEIDQLLKKGAYDVFRDEDDAEAKQFLESDIDQLLERSAKKVTYDNMNANSISSGLGSFSKASFVADTGDGIKDVDLDDPDFWEKAVGLNVPAETPEEIAAMLDDGVKRSRKQVQQFDPYAAFAEVEQKKKSKVEQRIKEEKEEKERLRVLKKAKKLEEKEKKKREREDVRGRLFGQSSRPELQQEDDDEDEEDGAKTTTKEGKTKKMKKAERRRALRRAENEDPIMERLKQAWDVPQRNRATSAALRFGFGRFCKMRNESNLTSLPIQDLEVFFRSYIYQLSLQVAVTLLAMLRSQLAPFTKSSSELHIRHLLGKWLGQRSKAELEWICGSIYSVLEMQIEVENQRRPLRLPLTLAEPSYTAELRQGAALRALRRISVMNRLNAIVENALDDILTDLGHEELGKRGCLTKDLSSLDADLKARYVTTEELSLALSAHLRYGHNDCRDPCTWWDRSCDVALLIGTFVYGLSAYETMRNDEELPFAERIREQASVNESCSAAHVSFLAAARMARTVFDNALDSAKSKAQEEAHAVVAAAVAATKIAEESAELDARPASITAEDLQLNEDADDTHLVTLTRLSNAMAAAARDGAAALAKSRLDDVTDIATKENESDDEEQSAKEFPLHQRLPMPDARVLDSLLVQLIGHMEGNVSPETLDTTNGSSEPEWRSGKDALVHEQARSKALSTVLGMTKLQVNDERRDFSGIGYNGAQCAATHRSLDDGSDYCVGAASVELSHVSTGNDAPRYLRALGVPMNITRYAASALLYADSKTLETMLSEEHSRNFIEDEESDEENDAEKENGAADSGAPKEADSKPSAQADTKPTAAVLPQPPVTPIAPSFRDSAPLRAGLCASALHYGYTTVASSNFCVDTAILSELERHVSSLETSHHYPLYSLGSFISAASTLMDHVNVPSADAVSEYIESVLLPHCLRVCVMGNGPSTRSARGSKGKFETAYGISNYPEYTDSRQTPLPDPCASLAEHSIESVACASAILRRTRLMRAAQHIVSGGVAFSQLMEILQSAVIRGSMDDLPVWWCPEIHDLGLLVHAATRGLFSILGDRKAGITNSVFCPETIKQHIYNTVVSESKARGNNALLDDVSVWVEEQSVQFPSANALERRLGLLCSQATSHLGNDIARYNNLPMFDHGGWPRN